LAQDLEKKYRDFSYIPQPGEWDAVEKVREKYRNLIALRSALEEYLKQLSGVILQAEGREAGKTFLKTAPLVIVGAVLIETDWPLVFRLGQAGTAGVAAAESEIGLQIWFQLATKLNSARTVIADLAVAALGTDADLQVMDQIRTWGNQFTDPKELLDQIESVYKIIENIDGKISP
jgi:hypothetical protein